MTEALGEVKRLIDALDKADEDVKDAEETLKSRKERARKLREEYIPSAMAELGYNEVKLDSGEKVTIKDEVYASVPARSKPLAFQWLRSHGFDSLIKTDLKVTFGKGDDEAAKKLREELTEEGLNFNTTENIHPQTLRAFIKERLRDGEDIPLDLFGAQPVQVAVVKKS